jgi:hypothetical protein
MRLLKASFAAAAMAAALLAAAPPALAAIAPGDLIKLPDDGDLNTTVDSAVYFYGADNKRYVFPNSQTYFTWYADFSAVKTVSASEMAALPIGGNITYRPGTRLVKITSDPNVYAVEPGGKLRHVQSEAIAKSLYGDDWNKRIDDIPDAFFFNYSTGDPLAAAVYPDGTIVKRTTDNVYFRIENRQKRKIISTEVKSALRVQEPFVIPTASALGDYPDASDITVAEPAITDTAQKNLSTIPSVPTLTVRIPSTSFIAVGGDITLLELRLASVKSFTVKKLVVRIDATTDNPANKAVVDDDRGGLVYENNAQPNLKQIRFLDENGVEVFGRSDIVTDVAQDQSQSFTFAGSYTVPSGIEKVLTLRAQLNALLPNGEGYKVTLPLSGISIADAATGAATPFQPQADIAGTELKTLNASMEVLASSKPGNVTLVRGAKNAELAGLSFKATTVAPNTIKSVTFQGYVDEEGTAGFLPGTDNDNGSPRPLNELVAAVSLYDAAGAKVGGPVPVGSDGRASFTGLTYSIPAGQTATLVIRGDVSPTVELETNPDRIAFDVTDASTDMSVVDDKGGKVPAIGKLPNGGDKAVSYATIRKNGTIVYRWDPSGVAVITGREILLGTLSADVKYDSYTLKSVSFRAVGEHGSLGDLRLEYPAAGGVASKTGTFDGDIVLFAGLAVDMPVDKKTDLKLYGKIKPRDAGAVYGQPINMKFGNADALAFESKSSGEDYDQSSWGADFTLASNNSLVGAVRYTELTAAKDAGSPASVFRGSDAEVLRFTLTPAAEGAARIKKMTFKISAGDAGYPDTTKPENAGKPTSDNDGLERWADMNGDFADDDAIINLNRVSGTSKTLLAEGSGARIQYSIVKGGAKDTTPQGLDSAVGDYGLIEIIFDDGNEYSLAAGVAAVFSLELITSAMSDQSDWALGVDLLGGADFEWTDVPSGAYTATQGAGGLPVSAAVTVKR